MSTAPAPRYVIGNGPDRLDRARWAAWYAGVLDSSGGDVEGFSSVLAEARGILGSEEAGAYFGRGFGGLTMDGRPRGSLIRRSAAELKLFKLVPDQV